MNISDVENLAELARLELTTIEKEELLFDMESILGYVKQIESVDIGDMQTEYITHNVWREDLLVVAGVEGSCGFSRDIIVKQFPASQDGFLKVKKIL